MKINRATVLILIGGLFIISSISYPFYETSAVLFYEDQIIGSYVYIVLLLGFLSMLAPIIQDAGFLKQHGRAGNFLLYFTFTAILVAILLRSFTSFGSVASLKSGFFVYVIGALLIFIGSVSFFSTKE
ncbi:MAG TPA: hypothetical protein VKU94_06495 [Geobacterales bacterium]|nr:hypothetical protein [Geobacterales bacterium]